MQNNTNMNALEEDLQVYFIDHSQRELHVNFNTDIKDPSHYGDFNQSLRSLGEEDSLHLHFNTNGGNLNSAVEMINNIQSCPATCIGYLGADASSAGSMMFISCDTWVIHELSTMMIHGPSSGTIGAVPNMVTQVDQLKELSKRVMNKYYKGFLTDEEIQGFIDGRPDMYLFAEEIEERLKNLQKYREEQYEKMVEDMEEKSNECDE